jgi:hypothetical protein
VRAEQLAADRWRRAAMPAATNTAAPPSVQLVRRPVLRKNTGITTSSTWWRSRSIRSWSNQSVSMIAPARKAPTMKCRPDQSAPKAQAASQIRPRTSGRVPPAPHQPAKA